MSRILQDQEAREPPRSELPYLFGASNHERHVELLGIDQHQTLHNIIGFRRFIDQSATVDFYPKVVRTRRHIAPRNKNGLSKGSTPSQLIESRGAKRRRQRGVAVERYLDRGAELAIAVVADVRR